MTDRPKKKRLWHVDPSIFQKGPKAGFLERYILSRARNLGKYALYGAAFAYPLVLVGLGIAFGGLVFWSSFAGSMLLIWLVIKKTGYSKNFENWDISYRKFAGLIGGCAAALAFFYGIIYVKMWTIPFVAAVLLGALIISIWIRDR